MTVIRDQWLHQEIIHQYIAILCRPKIRLWVEIEKRSLSFEMLSEISLDIFIFKLKFLSCVLVCELWCPKIPFYLLVTDIYLLICKSIYTLKSLGKKKSKEDLREFETLLINPDSYTICVIFFMFWDLPYPKGHAFQRLLAAVMHRCKLEWQIYVFTPALITVLSCL